MTEEQAKKKRGRPPINAAPLSGSERMRRYTEKLKDKGKHYNIFVSGEYLQYISVLAEQTKATETEVIRGIVEVSLKRFIGIQQVSIQMLADGHTQEQVAKYMSDNIDPDLTNPANYKEIQ